MSLLKDKALCTIYRSERKQGAYLYVPFSTADNVFEGVPEALLKQLGQLTEVMKLNLSDGKKLANADVDKVRQQLGDKGYYLQLPPSDPVATRQQHRFDICSDGAKQ